MKPLNATPMKKQATQKATDAKGFGVTALLGVKLFMYAATLRWPHGVRMVSMFMRPMTSHTTRAMGAARRRRYSPYPIPKPTTAYPR